jgi:acetyl-CoA decarbonylase/synthase complex subunit gamma
MTLRQNIFTDPQKPLQVEAKIYEFNNPDENSLIFMTTNFALTFFAVASELESLSVPSYLIVTPADGMSVLTAWSAEKFTSQMVARTLKKWDFASRVKNRKIIIPGLLSHMKEELEEALEDFEIVVGTVDAYAISDFVKQFYKS